MKCLFLFGMFHLSEAELFCYTWVITVRKKFTFFTQLQRKNIDFDLYKSAPLKLPPCMQILTVLKEKRSFFYVTQAYTFKTSQEILAQIYLC